MDSAPHPLRVSVVIPMFNGERYVARAIESVLAQDHPAKEVLVVDDGSRDASREVVARYLHHQNVRLIAQQNAGVAAARNAGIRHAGGEYIAVLDQDDLWLPKKLALQVEYLDEHRDVGLVHSNIHFIDAAGERVPDPEWAWVAPTFGRCLPELIHRNRICTSSTLMRKHALEETGLFRQSLAPADDWDLWLRIAARYPLGFIEEVTACYRIHGDNESRDLLGMQEAEIRVVETFAHEHGGVDGNALLRATLFSLYGEAARLLERTGRHAAARAYWLRAIRTRPVAWKSYVSLILDTVPARQRRALNWYRERLRGLRAERRR